MTLSYYYYMTLTQKNLGFYSLDWLEFFHQDLHRQLFPPKMGSFIKSNVLCSMYHFYGTLTKNIAVRLRRLFLLLRNWSSTNWLNILGPKNSILSNFSQKWRLRRIWSREKIKPRGIAQFLYTFWLVSWDQDKVYTSRVLRYLNIDQIHDWHFLQDQSRCLSKGGSKKSSWHRHQSVSNTQKVDLSIMPC